MGIRRFRLGVATTGLRVNGTEVDDDVEGRPSSFSPGPPSMTAARCLPLYPREEYGRCVEAALQESPFRPM